VKSIVGVFGLIWKLYILVIFMATTLLSYPIIAAKLIDTKGKMRAFRVFVFWSWTFRFLCLYGVKRLKNAPLPNGPYLIAANHCSYLDIFLMYSILPKAPFLFLGKSEILRYPLIKTFFKRMNIPVHRKNRIKSARAIIKAGSEVRKGWSIMIFPEGEIPNSNHPTMVDFKQGAFQLAKSLSIPIVPITFTNNHKLFSDPTELLGRAHPGISKVFIHEFISKDEVDRLSQNELTKRCFDTINAPILDLK
jgi:1-acyl-sn-glycerol-3-phosphate acyltransferase